MNGRLFLVLLLMVYFSCGSGKVITDKPDGIITSASWPGTVKIISIGIPGKSCSGQKDYVDVIFDFTPDSADAAKKYLVKDVSDKNKNSHRRVIDLDANIICIITDIDVVEKRIYFNIILSDNNIYWYTGPDEANIANWNIEFEKIETNKQN